MKKTILFLILTLSACGYGTVELLPSKCLLDPAVVKNLDSWRFRYTEISGTCGFLPDVVTTLNNTSLPAGCELNYRVFRPNTCSLESQVFCYNVNNQVSFMVATADTIQLGRNHLSSQYTLSLTDYYGNPVCSSVYSVDVNRL